VRNWAVWSNGAQRFDKRRYFFRLSAEARRMYIARSQAYNLGIAKKAAIPGFVKMDLVVTKVG
jgi:hypothetical protein